MILLVAVLSAAAAAVLPPAAVAILPAGAGTAASSIGIYMA